MDRSSQHIGLLAATAMSIEIGILRPISYGYCWDCKREGLVYEVLVGPPQAPRCPTCMFTSSTSMASEFPETIEEHLPVAECC